MSCAKRSAKQHIATSPASRAPQAHRTLCSGSSGPRTSQATSGASRNVLYKQAARPVGQQRVLVLGRNRGGRAKLESFQAPRYSKRQLIRPVSFRMPRLSALLCEGGEIRRRKSPIALPLQSSATQSPTSLFLLFQRCIEPTEFPSSCPAIIESISVSKGSQFERIRRRKREGGAKFQSPQRRYDSCQRRRSTTKTYRSNTNLTRTSYVLHYVASVICQLSARCRRRHPVRLPRPHRISTSLTISTAR